MTDFTTTEGLYQAEYRGFATVEHLINSRLSDVPKIGGVYLTLWDALGSPDFLTNSPAGHFKEQDPTVSIAELEANWVPGAIVINISKAGGLGIKATLHSRIRQYLKFGQGKPVGHRGGRYVWQIKTPVRLQICWRPTPYENPRDVEIGLLKEFHTYYGRLPFANLQL
jgi:hypothetical protein